MKEAFQAFLQELKYDPKQKQFLSTMLIGSVGLAILFFARTNYPENTRFVSSGLAHIWTQHFGDPKNPAVLLVHSAGSISTFWPDYFCQDLSDNGFFVIRYDQRDSGYSTHFPKASPGSPGPYGVRELVKDAWAVLDGYNIKKCYLVGHAMGASLLKFMMLQHPERSNASVLISAGISHKPEILNRLSLKPRTIETEQILFYKELEANFRNDWPHWKRTLRYIHGSYAMKNKEAKRYIREIYRRDLRDARVAWNHIATFETYPETLVEDLKTITIPTLIIHGKEDCVVPFTHGKAIAQLMPHSEFVALEKVGHMFFNPEIWHRLTNEIIGFLKRH